MYITSSLYTDKTRTNQTLRLVVDQGHFISHYSCFSDSLLPTNLTWRLDGESSTISEGSEANDGLKLEWNKKMDFSDSGKYICTGTNKNGDSTAVIDLIVKRK